ncbi:MAG: hypothetical protein O3C28_03910 [Proteobacteria bacterium]|nr:hypothetical protein [Pseudomonadota bacterium]
MPQFQNYIKSKTSATFSDSVVVDFGDRAAELQLARTASVKCPLLSVGVVSISGADAVSFINGQFTTNCNDLTTNTGQLSSWCDPKGRVLFLFNLYRDDTQIFAVLPKTQIERFLARLRMYVLRADVQLVDLTSFCSVFGVIGNTRIAQVETASLIDTRATAHPADGTSIVRYGSGRPRFIVVGPDSTAVDRWRELSIPPAGEAVWCAMDSFAGAPRIDEHSQGQYLPQQLNLDRLDGVSFSKGCYPGQEIIARLKYRGEVKKRLRSFVCSGDKDLGAATRLLNRDDERLIGHVLYAQRIDAQEQIFSAVVDIDAECASISFEGQSDSNLHELELPYPAP